MQVGFLSFFVLVNRKAHAACSGAELGVSRDLCSPRDIVRIVLANQNSALVGCLLGPGRDSSVACFIRCLANSCRGRLSCLFDLELGLAAYLKSKRQGLRSSRGWSLKPSGFSYNTTATPTAALSRPRDRFEDPTHRTPLHIHRSSKNLREADGCLRQS